MKVLEKSKLSVLKEKLHLFAADIPRELYLLERNKKYSVYTVTNRLNEIGSWKGDEFQLMKLLIDSPDFKLIQGFISRISL
tara:strand:- start:1380 stop:1622 length:243 start_codon:yes stop_codon:yes gene_type:complete